MKKTVNQHLKQSLFDTWRKKYGREPHWTKPDYVMLANYQKAQPNLDPLHMLDAFDKFLEDQSRFYAGHPLRMFIRDIDRFLELADL